MKKAENGRARSIAIDLARAAANLTKKDIATWRQAHRMALNPENPQRLRLYEVYLDASLDLHLSGAIAQRENFVLQKAFKLTDGSGKENRELSELFEAIWFKDFARLALDSRHWGHSLVQFGDVITVGGRRRFERVELVPREHVIPEYGVITRDAGDDPRRGVDYRRGELARWCVEAGDPRDLGLLLKCSPHALSKKNMLAFWDGFGELFGMPLRIGKTVSRDPGEIGKVERMLSEMGAAAWGLFPEGTDIEIKETSRGDAFNVYDRRVERANSEMSKCILGQTMTIDSGSSLSQSEVHLEVLENIVNADADFLRDLINNRLLPFMAMHGFAVEGYRFDWDDAPEYRPEQMRAVEQMLLGAGYGIEPKYFTEKYNIPVTGRREASPAAGTEMRFGGRDFFD